MVIRLEGERRGAGVRRGGGEEACSSGGGEQEVRRYQAIEASGRIGLGLQRPRAAEASGRRGLGLQRSVGTTNGIWFGQGIADGQVGQGG